MSNREAVTAYWNEVWSQSAGQIPTTALEILTDPEKTLSVTENCLYLEALKSANERRISTLEQEATNSRKRHQTIRTLIVSSGIALSSVCGLS